MFSPLIDELIASLRVLPGVGPKSAQRMALYLIERQKPGAERLARALLNAAEHVTRCTVCRTLSEETVCRMCVNSKRDDTLLCIVESPADVLAIEQAGSFTGRYFVLHGRLSPIDGIGPAELGLAELVERFKSGVVREVIVATNPTMEGEATALYIADKARDAGVRASRIAHGVPIGGELEYIDGGTLAHALSSRREI